MSVQIFISVIFIFCLFQSAFSSCILDGKYDLSTLDWPDGWKAPYSSNNTTKSYFHLQLCGHPIPQSGCGNSSVCLVTGNANESVSFGDVIANNSGYLTGKLGNGFSLFLMTKSKCASNVHRATVQFSCGPHLGAPEVMLRSECQVNFYWKTSAACSVKPPLHQVPCYVLDDHGERLDLSHLIQAKDSGHRVSTLDPATEFIINICSDLNYGNCSSGAAACRIAGEEHMAFGSLHDRLYNKPEGLSLTYISNVTVPGCSLPPKTTVTFRCPYREHSQPPQVVSDANCQYEVIWETEYACPESILKSNIKECQFSTQEHGVEIDLSPLKIPTYYTVNSSTNNMQRFVLSVCGGLTNYQCDGKTWKSISSCMVDGNSSTIVGTTAGTRLMYADQQVTLTYPKGSHCKDGLEHTSAINFVCDPKGIGNGIPRHISSHDCLHLFEWPTQHACLKRPLDTSCSVTYNHKKINLRSLFLLEKEAWEAIDATEAYPASYFLNVCGQVTHLSGLAGCGDDSSACVKFQNGSFLSLGSFRNSPTYDPVSNSVNLKYSGGSPCQNGKLWESVINFVCRPGQINSEPILKRVDFTNCRYEFEWQTADACPEGVVEGTNCKVYDEKIGIDYDLSSLRSSKPYEVETDSYKFYLGVCMAVSDSPCSNIDNSPSIHNIGVCQVEKSNNKSWKLGEPSSHLTYADGVVNLTYLSGDPYSDEHKTPRMTIVVFICDYRAGPGQPVFVEEANFAYIFHWYTVLVCPVTSRECLVHDPNSHLIYDLSSLSRSDKSWVNFISDGDLEKEIYLNVCRSVTQPSPCDSSAAACVVDPISGKAVVANAGSVVSGPVLDGPGHLTLTYTNGNPCVAFGENTTYSTVIHFLCGENMASNGPMFLSKLGACEYTFLWTTNAACPTGELQAKEKCQLLDPNSGFTFDLTSLRSTHPYRVQMPNGSQIEFNICGKVLDGCQTSSKLVTNVSMCFVDNDGNMMMDKLWTVADSYSLGYSLGQDLALTYGDASNLKVVIQFPCYDGALDIEPQFLHLENNLLVLEMKTRLACIPKPFDCTAVDSKGNMFDLNPLAKYKDGNWETSDFRPENVHLRYHINFCRPLNRVESYRCPGGSIAACQTNIAHPNTSGHDLGSIMSPPMVSNKGTVVIRYVNGSFCHNGQFRRSTTLNLFCSSETGALSFMGETPECEYVFSMDTPVACPLKSDYGENCVVKDPVFGYIFDLSPLRSKSDSYRLTVGEYEYIFNICDKLNGISGNCANSSVCQLKTGDAKFAKSLGLPNNKVAYRDGVISLEYTSGSGNCHGRYNRSTKITFTCDYSSQDKDGPIFISESENCSYLFEWKTVHACPPFVTTPCSIVDDQGVLYDLSPLSLPSDNYYVKNPFNRNQTFVLNVCRSVVYTSTSLCPYLAASCLLDNPKTPVNLGKVGKGPYIQDGKIKLRYTSGDPCMKGTRFWDSIIEFSCDTNDYDEPELVGLDDCTYYFDWPTPHACPPKTTPTKESDCAITDPVTGHVFNLTSLKNLGTIKVPVRNHIYHVSICGNVSTSSPCKEDDSGASSGVCQEESEGGRHWSGGRTTNQIEISNGILFLNYTGGSPCHSDRFQRNSIIQFHCGFGIGQPKFVSESHDCTYIFEWQTELACQGKMQCAVEKNGNILDLSDLTQTYHTAGSIVLGEDSIYYVSVCGPLPSIPGVSCPTGAGICKVLKHPKPNLPFAWSLGSMDMPPILDFTEDPSPNALYVNGSVCENKHDANNKARVIFTCDPEAGVGDPVLLEQTPSECMHVFEWATNVVCPKHPTQGICNYTDVSRGVHFDFGPLLKTQPYQVVNPKSGSVFQLNICTTSKSCGICESEGNRSTSHGSSATQRFAYDGRRVRITFQNGDDCPSGMDQKKSSEIFFICDATAGYGEPVIYKQYTCLTVFMWRTALVCRSRQERCAFEVADKYYNFNMLSSLSHNWYIGKDHKTYWINLCGGISPTTHTLGCSPMAAICQKSVYGQPLNLGNINSMKAKAINSSDLLLTFTSSDSRACVNVSATNPTSRLFMRCGPSLGKPILFSGPDSQCFYDFVWQSSLACERIPEQVMLEANNTITDMRFDYVINISDIVNHTFKVAGVHPADVYIYQINLSGVRPNSTDPSDPCARAAVCQTKPGFSRDIGSVSSRKFIVRASELHLELQSVTRPCGKNPSKNVTTLINIKCMTAAGIGRPVFRYESGDCDYIFDWNTDIVCPNYYKRHGNDPDSEPQREDTDNTVSTSGNTTEVVLGVVVCIVVIALLLFVFLQPQRRAYVSHRFRAAFGKVNIPYFRYKRGGERLVLVDAADPLDDVDVDILA